MTNEPLQPYDLPDIEEDAGDVHALLARRKAIAHVWHVSDVTEVRPHLSEDQAWQVLQAVERRLDSEHGINWDVVRDAADDLFPGPPEALAGGDGV